ncbi:uncharacterized protein si:dkeyp-69c1.9 isoform X1 [Electrophorus electricus]|uniref:uncharacterized protein si:dkeyp-69c1.9 isoform X1 n=1 Tax=Electrophorus electricus TaxID=8005 RepID=UPI0015D0B9D1|nr:uncharacterized protein si:dkeyp-69c1.9 isoform X1 [Electrophorus electricus]
MLQCNLILEGDRSFITTHREAYQAQPLDGAPLLMRKSSVNDARTLKEQTTKPLPHYQTNYQQNFLPPQGISMRRLQALPCPDNLAVNPALRTDFRTVQMETYPGWDIPLHSRIFPAQLREQQFKNEALTLNVSSRKASTLISPVSNGRSFENMWPALAQKH